VSEAPRSLLLVAIRQIGDVLLATPLLRSLRRAYPEAAIDVLVYSEKGGMLEGNPDCNEVIAVDEHPDLRGTLRLLRRIFRRYDLALTIQATDRAHLYSWLAAGRRVGLVPDLGAASAWKRRSCASWAALDNVDTHTVAQNLVLADLLGIPRCHEVVPPRDAGAERELAALPLAAGEPIAVLHPFPMWRYKRWTREGWEALIAWLRARGLQVVLTGGPEPEERAFCAALAADTGALDLAGRLPFGVLAALLQRARLYVGPDTSVTHLAAACGTPTLALYGPSNPVKWGPWPKGCDAEHSPYRMLARPWQRSGNVLLLQGIQPLDLGQCVPCRGEGCDKHKASFSRCLTEMPAEPVIEAAAALLET
jgi:heptosyltransferase-3